MVSVRVALVASGGPGQPGLGKTGGASPAPTDSSSLPGGKFPCVPEDKTPIGTFWFAALFVALAILIDANYATP
jgi:hypothetical protein